MGNGYVPLNLKLKMFLSGKKNYFFNFYCLILKVLIKYFNPLVYLKTYYFLPQKCLMPSAISISFYDFGYRQNPHLTSSLSLLFLHHLRTAKQKKNFFFFSKFETKYIKKEENTSKRGRHSCLF